jgi:uncharacterized protein YcfJ
MRRILLATGLAACVAIPSAADAASCSSRKTTGTAIGAVAGGLLGNAVAGRGVRTEGTLLGAGVGAVVGHQVAKGGCQRTAYRTTRSYRNSSYRPARNSNYRQASNACSYENRPYYDERGQLVYAPTRVCR